MNYFSIGSGSSGNCAYISSGDTAILLDAGISGKKMLCALDEKGIDVDSIDGIFVTHEHRDHISCLGVYSRKFHIPIFATPGTIREIKQSSSLGEIDDSLINPINSKEDFRFKDFIIHPLPISHDAAEPVGYIIRDSFVSLGIVSDLGKYDDYIKESLLGLDGIVLESNHDVRMLETGIYPYPLKRRIASEYGHLSNEDCGRLLSDILHDDLKWIVLSHLSAENNYDRLAIESVSLEINVSDKPYRAKDFPMYIAPRKEPGAMFYL